MRRINAARLFCLVMAVGPVMAWAANGYDQNGRADRNSEKMEAASGTVVKPVPSIDIDRYSGTWYEVAALPDRFDKGCFSDSTTTYSIQPDNRRIHIEKRCRTRAGGEQKAEGVLRVKNASDVNSKMEVRYMPNWLSWLPITWRDYWVIELDPDYHYAVVGTPDRHHMWILSRSPVLDQQTYEMLIEKTRAQGYPVDKLQRMQQGGAPAAAPAGQQQQGNY